MYRRHVILNPCYKIESSMAKSHLQSGSLHNVQKLSNIKTTVLNNGNYTKLHIQEPYLYKLVTYAPKPSIMPNPLVKRITNKIASCQTGSRSFWSLNKVVSQSFCHSSFPPLKKQLWLIFMHSFL